VLRYTNYNLISCKDSARHFAWGERIIMLESPQKLIELLRRDHRYRFDGYIFVMEALQYAQQQLGRGCIASEDELDDGEQETRHVSGQELCESIRRYALQQFGLLASQVFAHWGIRRTADFGEIVYNLIEIGDFRKTDGDRREDFEDVFDFGRDLRDRSVFRLPAKGQGKPIP
jgi:uncharacterized repeat protein (TIGR04138 family)